MNEKRLTSYLPLLVMSALIITSDFLDTKLFPIGDMSFAVWFILSVFCFACGYYLNKPLGWAQGTKLVFAVSIAAAIVSISLITFFKEYFQMPQLNAEVIIVFALRNVFLGSMSFFGMAISEVMLQQIKIAGQTEKLQFIEDTIKDARKESDLVIREAQVKANKILNEAELNAKNTILKKERIERELKEFIQIEKELIKKYEET